MKLAVAVIPETLYEPIRYPAALCQSASADDLLVEITPRAAQQLQLQIGQSLWCLIKSQAIKRLNAPHHTA